MKVSNIEETQKNILSNKEEMATKKLSLAILNVEAQLELIAKAQNIKPQQGLQSGIENPKKVMEITLRRS